jgi:hypothetical protein
VKRSMSLAGGLNMYGHLGERYCSDISPKGRKVRFLDENGYDIQREIARKYFSKGDILTIEEIYVGGSSSEVSFSEHPLKKFNTVMFEDVE